MKLSRSVAILLTLLLFWGQASFASNAGDVMVAAGATDMALMVPMDCGGSCDQDIEPCQDAACSAEHLCSGGSAFMVPVLMVSLVQGAADISSPQPDHYRYCSVTAIEHPPRITV
ncbi:hypothetical protein QKW35_05220 [Pontibacterium granulatum]|uniref:hypothetical protein n=1 Tax=Pontibacterium granulatum TaxID=2036029 RepID=UPI00249B177E|nr:hypothetical protein [Pontibacterium granulatum]MDI3323775.1 hypothetical protein [Pontibacterium granulatum]